MERTNENNDSENSGGIVPPDKNLVQRLVQGSERIRDEIERPDAPGGDPRQWILKSWEKSPKPNTDLYPYTERYYLTFNDGGDGSVKISGNYNPHSGRWHGPTFHFSKGQPNPAKWGPNGMMRNPPDLDTNENPISSDLNEWLDLFGSE